MQIIAAFQQLLISTVILPISFVLALMNLVGFKNTEYPRLWILDIKKGFLERKLQRVEKEFAKTDNEKKAEKLYCHYIAVQNQIHVLLEKMASIEEDKQMENILDLHNKKYEFKKVSLK